MATYDIRPLQLRMLGIIEVMDQVFRQHGISYGMFNGSLLGAVRHKGFIPWDDDMDIVMPRPDYERFIQHSHEWLPAPYEFVCPENDKAYPLPFGKVQDASTTLTEASMWMSSPWMPFPPTSSGGSCTRPTTPC